MVKKNTQKTNRVNKTHKYLLVMLFFAIPLLIFIILANIIVVDGENCVVCKCSKSVVTVKKLTQVDKCDLIGACDNRITLWQKIICDVTGERYP